MASSYSLDLRDRVVAFVEAGHSRRATGRRFPGIVEAEPDITMPEPSARLLAAHAIVAAPAVLSRFLCRPRVHI